MDLRHSALRFYTIPSIRPFSRSILHCRTSRFSNIGSSLPFPPEKAKYHRELQTAVDVVQRACRLCVDVQKSLFAADARILEKNDSTPVTVADFGVQALVSLGYFLNPQFTYERHDYNIREDEEVMRGVKKVIQRLEPNIDNQIRALNELEIYSLKQEDFSDIVTQRAVKFTNPELSKIFPSIPLVAEEDSAFLRSNNLTNAVVKVVNDVASAGDRKLTDMEVLDAIDRGGKNTLAFGAKPATYWVLDPIDGTKGFLKGPNSMYVVGLALIVQGEIVLGVMGCPNWKEDISSQPTNVIGKSQSASGIMMMAHLNCGTWTLRLSDMLDGGISLCSSWTRSFVDGCCLVHKAQFCIPDSQTWDLFPLSSVYSATTDANCIGEEQILLRPTCCGSLCKYLTVASGRASVFILRVLSQKTIKAWDHAVGMLCVHEAGGKVTDWKGSQLDLAADRAERRVIFPFGGVLVTNGNLHSQIIEMISFDSKLMS